MIRCLAADDEQPALDLLEDNIQQVPYLHLVKTCRNAFEVMDILNKEPIDLVFLDIQMPGLTGIQFVNTLTERKPMVIFVTAYERFAVESYKVQAVDYLVKPVATERFIQACNRAKELFDLKNATIEPQNMAQMRHQVTQSVMAQNALTETMTEGGDFLFVNVEYSLVKVRFSDIQYISGLKDYIKIHLKNQEKPLLTAMNLKAIEEKLPQKQFIRVHKSFIVGFDHVEIIRNGFVIIEKEAIPIGDNFREKLMHLVLKK
jgi:two-component system, LytTR family, response regulator